LGHPGGGASVVASVSSGGAALCCTSRRITWRRMGKEKKIPLLMMGIYTKLWGYMGNDGNIFGYFRSISWDCHGNIMEVMMNIA
jgi:hypothetical protein